jgi:Flp pilus assembly CpaE family ATPase
MIYEAVDLALVLIIVAVPDVPSCRVTRRFNTA